MKNSTRTWINLFFHTLFLVLAQMVVVSNWSSLFGKSTMPMIWIPFIVYFALTRPLLQGLFGVYVCSIVTLFWTGAPTLMIIVVMLVPFFISRFVRSRIFWQSLSYFWLLSSICAFLWPSIYFFTSVLLEQKVLLTLDFSTAAGRFLTTVLITPVMYQLLQKIDLRTDPDGILTLGAREA